MITVEGGLARIYVQGKWLLASADHGKCMLDAQKKRQKQRYPVIDSEEWMGAVFVLFVERVDVGAEQERITVNVPSVMGMRNAAGITDS